MHENRWIGLGYLGLDPVLRHTQNGTPVTSIRMATTRKYRKRDAPPDAKPEEETTWVNVSVWGKRAEVVHKYLRKGSPVYVTGRLRNVEWTDSDGIQRYGMEVVAQQVELLPRGDGGGRKPPHPAEDPRGGPGDGYIPSHGDVPGGDEVPPPLDDDIPF